MKYLFPLLIALACNKPTNDLEKLHWLKGSWLLDDTTFSKHGIALYEQWTSEGDSVLKGVTMSVQGKDTQVEEEMKIVQRGRDLYYIATVSNQNGSESVPFKMQYLKNDSFCFSNPQHDFPKYILYFKTSGNTITACISDKMQYKHEFENYNFKVEEKFALFNYKKME